MTTPFLLASDDLGFLSEHREARKCESVPHGIMSIAGLFRTCLSSAVGIFLGFRRVILFTVMIITEEEDVSDMHGDISGHACSENGSRAQSSSPIQAAPQVSGFLSGL